MFDLGPGYFFEGQVMHLGMMTCHCNRVFLMHFFGEFLVGIQKDLGTLGFS